MLLLGTQMGPYHLLLIHLQTRCSVTPYLLFLFSPAMRTLFLWWLMKTALSQQLGGASCNQCHLIHSMVVGCASLTHHLLCHIGRISFLVLKHIPYQTGLKKRTVLSNDTKSTCHMSGCVAGNLMGKKISFSTSQPAIVSFWGLFFLMERKILQKYSSSFLPPLPAQLPF